MESPFPVSSSAPGQGHILVQILPTGGSGLEAISYQYPLKLISPSQASGRGSVLVFLLSYGGGLVGGDGINLSITVRPGARLSLVTQGHTKIFKSPSPNLMTRQTMDVSLDDEAGLCFLPDPVQPFGNSVYTQTQIVRASASSSLCLLDWVTRGRTARGEDWALCYWKGRNEIWLRDPQATRGDRLLVRDAVILSKEESGALGRPLSVTMHGQGVFGTLILRGKLMASLGDFFLAEFAALPRLGARGFRTGEDRDKERCTLSGFQQWRVQRIELEQRDGLTWSAAQVRGCVVVKFGATTVEAGRCWIGSMLVKEGSISMHFGDEALMCVR